MVFSDKVNIRDTVYRDIATGKELLEKVAENLIKKRQNLRWDALHLPFVNDCPIKGKADFLTQLNRLILT